MNSSIATSYCCEFLAVFSQHSTRSIHKQEADRNKCATFLKMFYLWLARICSGNLLQYQCGNIVDSVLYLLEKNKFIIVRLA